MSFVHLNLHASLLKALEQLKHHDATPIQQQVIPQVLAGKDVIATAQTGTGKTAAFLLPILEKIIQQPRKNNLPRALILTPTRELATQVKDAALAYGRHLRLNVATVLGGMPYGAQIRQFAKPVDIIVATPGRLMDLLEQKQVNLSAIETFVLDEADRMLDMGFIDDVKSISKMLPTKKQTLLFTATMDKNLVNLANSILHHPVRIEVQNKQITVEKIEQRMYVADDNHHKLKLLKHLLANASVYKAIIFSGTKRGTVNLADQLRDEGHRVGALHGDMRQPQRNRTLLKLREGKIHFLVATDVAARGIDIQDISHVVNYDMPKFAEDYVHRIGRTGRAGKSGIAISLVTSSDVRALRSIERYTKHIFKPEIIAGLEPRHAGLHEQSKPSSHKRRRRKPPQSHRQHHAAKHTKPFAGKEKRKQR